MAEQKGALSFTWKDKFFSKILSGNMVIDKNIENSLFSRALSRPEEYDLGQHMLSRLIGKF